ncbi:thiamine diphosphokinase [Peribacillus sp. B-H-3]|jgi:thiamine pyrophosphokinase|uniref:thiamine diphosphokinase n=1 Tax=Peribacillus sp. B-H-3 TaxID=3400420 RepID=UPI003B0182C5
MIICMLAGGPVHLLPDLLPYKNKADVWVGADRGVHHLLESGIVPDAAFGDFDSVTEGELENIQQKLENLKVYPSEKNESDLELAFQWAIRQKPEEIYILGATGGRLDHFFGNMQLLLKESILPLHNSISIYIADKQNTITVKTPGTYQIGRDPEKKYISFIPAASCIEGLTLQGFKYPLENRRVKRGSTLCVSNELISDIGHLSFSEGILLVIRSSD